MPPAGWVPPADWVPPAGWLPPAAVKAERSARTKIVALSVTVVLVLGALGVGAWRLQVARENDRKEQAAEAAAAAEREAEEAAAAEAAAEAARLEQELEDARLIHQDCQKQLKPLFNALGAIDARLDVGVTQSEFLTYVGDASIAYDRIRVNALGQGACLSAAAKLESAFNQYSSTASTWNDCIVDFYCDTDSIEPGMQAKWATASNFIKQGRRLVERMNPDGSTYDPEAATSLGA